MCGTHGDDASGETLEREIAAIWREALRLEQVGPHDNFFELGGNSLLGMDLAEKLSARFDLDIAAVTLFLNPTPHELARYVESLGTE